MCGNHLIFKNGMYPCLYRHRLYRKKSKLAERWLFFWLHLLFFMVRKFYLGTWPSSWRPHFQSSVSARFEHGPNTPTVDRIWWEVLYVCESHLLKRKLNVCWFFSKFSCSYADEDNHLGGGDRTRWKELTHLQSHKWEKNKILFYVNHSV